MGLMMLMTATMLMTVASGSKEALRFRYLKTAARIVNFAALLDMSPDEHET